MKKWGIIGALFFVAAVIVGYFAKFDASLIVEIACAAFGYTAIVVSAIKFSKEKQLKTWVTIAIVILASIGGVLCCIGGLSQNIFLEISGAALALLAVIFGIVFNKK